MTTYWRAPRAREPIRATVAMPGSKSITNRALVLAALSSDESIIRGPLIARDTSLMIAALRALGAHIRHDNDTLRVIPATPRGPADIDCGLAGTVMRFLPPVAALARGRSRFRGDESANRRPIDGLLRALRSLGADVRGNRLPFDVVGVGRIGGGEVTLDASESSQFVSGLLLAGPRFDQGVLARHEGSPVPSMPHLEMTVAMLRAAGVRVESDVSDPERCSWRIAPGPIRLGTLAVEPDLSSAAAFLAAAMVTGGTITVPAWPESTTQAGDRIREILTAMGASCHLGPAGLSVTGPAQAGGIDADLHDVGELVPTVAAVCLFASGTSVLRGIAHLRGHETDRLDALAREIERLGGCAEVGEDRIEITPSPLHSADIRSYADHRMATFGAIVGLAVSDVTVEDIGTTSKTIPDFAGRWQRMVGASS